MNQRTENPSTKLRASREQRSENQFGFTLLEVVISLGIVLSVIAAFVGIQVLIRQSYLFSFNTSLTLENANAASQQIIRTLRNAQASDTGAFLLEVVDDQEVVVYSNIDSDPQTERVRYFLDGSDLKQGVIEPTSFPITYPQDSEKVKTLTAYIRNGAVPIFYYYNGGWPTDTTNNPLPQAQRLSDTRFISLLVKVNASPERPEAEFTVSPTVQIRNLKDNL